MSWPALDGNISTGAGGELLSTTSTKPEIHRRIHSVHPVYMLFLSHFYQQLWYAGDLVNGICIKRYLLKLLLLLRVVVIVVVVDVVVIIIMVVIIIIRKK